MLKKVLIGVAVVAVLGVGAYFLFGNKDNDTANNSTANTNTSANSQTATSDQPESGNIYSLADAGTARTCTFTYTGSTGTGTGTMYADGKGRGLMTMKVETSSGKTLTTNTLLLSDKVYGWTGSTGFVYKKSTLESGQSQSSSSSGSSSTTADPSKNYSLKCAGWTVDESMLTVPSDVNFTSI